MSPILDPNLSAPRARLGGERSEGDHGESSLPYRVVTLCLVIIPFLGLAAAIGMIWAVPFRAVYLALFFGLYIVTGLGITIGYHRLFTHKSFSCGPVTRYVLAALGSMALEGSVLHWCAIHRRHHQHSDCDQDPHSPHFHGPGVSGIVRGFAHSHVGWMMRPDSPGMARYVPDLAADRVVSAASRHFALWVIIGLILPAVIAGVLTMSWWGALLGFLWGGLARILLVHHITWSVNSVCHIWGGRPFRSNDESRNNPIFGWLALGEGWHNNHHVFPTSARHGLLRGQFDLSYVVIRLLERLGLVWNIRVPDAERLAAKRVEGATPRRIVVRVEKYRQTPTARPTDTHVDAG